MYCPAAQPLRPLLPQSLDPSPAQALPCSCLQSLGRLASASVGQSTLSLLTTQLPFFHSTPAHYQTQQPCELKPQKSIPKLELSQQILQQARQSHSLAVSPSSPPPSNHSALQSLRVTTVVQQLPCLSAAHLSSTKQSDASALNLSIAQWLIHRSSFPVALVNPVCPSGLSTGKCHFLSGECSATWPLSY